MKLLSKSILILFLTLTIAACGGGGGGSGGDEVQAPVASDQSSVTESSSQSSSTPEEAPTPQEAPTSSETAESSDEEQEVATQDIEADAGFDFRVTREIQLNFVQVPDHRGSLSIYHGREVESEDEILINYLTRLTSIRPVEGSVIAVDVNDNWPELLFHWVPEGPETESIFAIALNADQVSYDISF
ncbi:MAG: hypothetical protein JJ934_00140 [Pseudomonadales bacterium]|nr:hypothetical protein [Pseudomonadales bacterium]MBO6597230.1 hypothetical protein [Pseudomonadales bacterium]MBO6655264.1 hypothetical protein [Pseudomonadales bacterium]MBO6703859.1 hypothetical protein [Pseudomonadales bacterium]MBO6823584.1 hypothetical protein [Pseudomonadales bacterium]